MSRSDIWSLLFWSGCAIVVYTFAGYALLISALARIVRRRPLPTACNSLPSVSVVLIAYNEEKRILARLKNLLGGDYPPEKLEVIVVADGCSDGTVEQTRMLGDPRVRLIEQPSRRGKAAGVNRAISLATGELIVFADARQRFAADAIPQLVSNFADPKVGAVSGNHSMDPSVSNIGGGVDLYWRLEKKIRFAEATVDSSVGCTGAIYSIRRKLFRPIPPDTILDDVVIPMEVAGQGYRVLFEPRAECFDPQASEPARERLRKKRTLAGNFQMLFRYPSWLLPWKHRLWWQLISHKYLRIMAPLFLALVFVSNLALAGSPFYRVLLAGQSAFYGLAALGAVFSSLKLRLFSVPVGFCFLNLMTVGGLWNYLRGTYRGGRW